VTTIQAARSMLFVPGNRPDRFAKAAASGADLVVLDLEDAVPEDRKAQARDAVVAHLRAGGEAAVRINGLGTPWHEEDVSALRGLPHAIMLPKADASPDALRLIADFGSHGTPTLALVESAAGVLTSPELAATAGVERLVFGSLDLAAELGVDPESPTLSQARLALVLASAAAKISLPVDGVTVQIEDEAELSSHAALANALGFGGKLCIHPRQVEVVNAAFSPTAEDVAWAREIVSVVGAAGSGAGVVTLRGAMIDKPVIMRAQRILEASTRQVR
jgi:citrate lyase subunit beta/citryl-CoA lyase